MVDIQHLDNCINKLSGGKLTDRVVLYIHIDTSSYPTNPFSLYFADSPSLDTSELGTR